MEFETITLKKAGAVAVITMNRPNVLNALNSKMLGELRQVAENIESNREIRAFIITGEGPKAFVAGADINELDHLPPIEGLRFMQMGQSVFNYIENMSKPSIAAVNGYALGGGNELCMCCDIRIASSRAKFGQPEIKLGNIPGWGGTQRLPRLIGKSRACEMIFTGEFIDAEEAARIGLVNRVVAPEELLDAAMETAEKIAAMSPNALNLAKISINEGLRSNIETGMSVEASGVALCLTTEDQKEGVDAFLQKRKPCFTGK
ncbi:crotonase [Synergistales bacterium]|nr:crotonase [Synergistales bacterium]